MRILVFAPHNDDEVLGAGGTIAKYAANGDDVYVCEATTGGNIDIKLAMNVRSDALKAHKILGVRDTFFLDLPVVAIKDTPTIEVNRKFDEIVRLVKPNIAFIPHRGDIHIDHSEVAKAAMVALRPIPNPQLQAIYAYETLSETEWNTPSLDNAFIPNCYSDITDFVMLKMDAMSCFSTQVRTYPHPRSLEAIEALSKLRGSTIGVKNAESFILIRMRF